MGNFLINQGGLQPYESRPDTLEENVSRGQQRGAAGTLPVENLLNDQEGVRVALSAEAERAASAELERQAASADRDREEQDPIFSVQTMAAEGRAGDADIEPGSYVNILI